MFKRDIMRKSATTLAPEVTGDELVTLLSVLRDNMLTGPHLEIGTAAGGTLKELILSYPEGKRRRFVVVDPMSYFPDQMAIVRRNLSSAGIDPDTIEFRVGKSWPMFQSAERNGERFSFIFIDGSHKIHHVTEDLAWTRLLEAGGIVCFHDYVPRFPGVIKPVDRFLKRHPNYSIIERVESLLIVRKNAATDSREITPWDRMRARLLNIRYQIGHSLQKRMRSYNDRKTRKC